MLVAGDEMGRTQGGNNNAYCQDNEVSWVDWSLLDAPRWRELRDLAARLIALRRAHPVLRRGGFFSGLSLAPEGLRDVAWFGPDGREMADGDWFASSSTLGMFLSGRDIPQRDARGRPVVDDSFLLIAHAGHRATAFTLPDAPWAAGYELLLDTAREQAWAAGDADAAAEGAGTADAAATGGAGTAGGDAQDAAAEGPAAGGAGAKGPGPQGASAAAGERVTVPARSLRLYRVRDIR
jgi:glycogen operon protein